MCAGWCTLFLFRTHFRFIHLIDVAFIWQQSECVAIKKEILHEFGGRRAQNPNNKLFQMCLMELSIWAQIEFDIKLRPNEGLRECDGVAGVLQGYLWRQSNVKLQITSRAKSIFNIRMRPKFLPAQNLFACTKPALYGLYAWHGRAILGNSISR